VFERRDRFLRAYGLAAALAAIVLTAGCGGQEAVDRALAKRMAGRTRTVAGERLLEPDAVAKFYEARGRHAVWGRHRDDEVVAAIDSAAADGLDPRDYHREAIQRLLDADRRDHVPEQRADLDVLMTDAVAAIADHVHYGRVRPRTLNPEWNIDPRAHAVPVEQTLAEIVRSGSVPRALAGQRPDHFIYRGLVGALAQLRGLEHAGGWPSVPAGPPIRPGANDARVPRLRARLAAGGEFDGSANSTSTRYDAALQRAVATFKARHRMDTTAVVDRVTIDEMNVPVAARIAQVRVNLERARWVLGGIDDDFVLVNLPAFKAYLIRGGKVEWEGRTQIGDEAKQKTPTFRSDIKTVVFNPDWSVPPSIVANELAPEMADGHDVLAEKGLVVLDGENHEVDAHAVDWSDAITAPIPYTVRQPPGPTNPLGQVKFLFPNAFSIYLHDTPSRGLFESSQRTFSHGCIRLEHPLDLAHRLLQGQPGWDDARVASVLESGELTNVSLAHPIPIIIVYWTVSVGASGEVRYAHDIYDYDPPLLAALDAPPTPARERVPAAMGAAASRSHRARRAAAQPLTGNWALATPPRRSGGR